MNDEWNAKVWFDTFFEDVLNVHDGIYDNIGCIVDDINRIWIFVIN